MRNRKCLFFLWMILVWSSSMSQCVETVNSTDGYTVTVLLDPVAITAPSSCPFGYNFNIVVDYDIQFSGINIPSSLFTLQSTIDCSSASNIFLNLPNSGGTGTAATNTNPFTSATDCATATPTSLGCNNFNVTINGPGIVNQTLTCPVTGPLPVVWDAFTVHVVDQHIRLDWRTLSEINNDFFRIQRSADAQQWQEIGTIRGNGNSTAANSYIFLDEAPLSGTSYYRLQQVDFNGAADWSEIRTITLKAPSLEFAISPNPIEDVVHIRLLTSAHEATIEIYDLFGKEHGKYHFNELNGPVRMALDVTNLNAGMYIARVSSGNQLKIVQFLKN